MIFLCFLQNVAQIVDIFGIFFPMRPRDQFELATPVVHIGNFESRQAKKLSWS
jgi:hypothetical protein